MSYFKTHFKKAKALLKFMYVKFKVQIPVKPEILVKLKFTLYVI